MSYFVDAPYIVYHILFTIVNMPDAVNRRFIAVFQQNCGTAEHCYEVNCPNFGQMIKKGLTMEKI